MASTDCIVKELSGTYSSPPWPLISISFSNKGRELLISGSFGLLIITMCNLQGNLKGRGNFSSPLESLWSHVSREFFKDLWPNPVLPSVTRITYFNKKDLHRCADLKWFGLISFWKIQIDYSEGCNDIQEYTPKYCSTHKNKRVLSWYENCIPVYRNNHILII